MEFNVIADKIKYYRKKLNLSQEELGEKLFVSKQTISLWEKGQTVPTVDNLIRLKEIFGVSVDEIMSPEIEEKEVLEAREEYSFSYYTDEELLQFKKHRTKPLIVSIVVILIALLVSVFFCLVDEANSFSIGMCVFLAIMLWIFISSFFNNKKVIKNDIGIIKSRLYEMLVYDDYFFYEVKCEDVITSSGRVKFSEVTSIEDIGKTLILTFRNGYILMRKERMKSDSVFYTISKDLIENKKIKPPIKKWKAISIILVILSILSYPIAECLQTAIFGEDAVYGWVYYIFLIIPIASLIFAFLLRKNRYKYKKNIITAIVMIIVLIVFGQLSVDNYDEYIEDSYLYDVVEDVLVFDLPEYSSVASMTWYEESEIIPDKEYVYNTSDLFFNQEDVAEFEKKIKTDKRWLTEIPDELKSSMTSIVSADSYDYMLIYNLTMDEFNTQIKVAEDEEFHDFIGCFYNSKTNQMKLVDYSLFVG